LRAQEAHTPPKNNILDSEITIGSFLWPNGLRRSKMKAYERKKQLMKENVTRSAHALTGLMFAPSAIMF